MVQLLSVTEWCWCYGILLVLVVFYVSCLYSIVSAPYCCFLLFPRRAVGIVTSEFRIEFLPRRVGILLFRVVLVLVLLQRHGGTIVFLVVVMVFPRHRVVCAAGGGQSGGQQQVRTRACERVNECGPSLDGVLCVCVCVYWITARCLL